MNFIKVKHVLIFFLLLSNCQHTSRVDKSLTLKKECGILNIHVGRIYKGESLFVYYNNALLYKQLYSVRNIINNNNINEKIPIHYANTGIIRLKISGGDAVPIDTVFRICKQNFQYYILVGYPMSKKLNDISKFPLSGYDYRKYPRAVALKPDTIFKNTISVQ